MVLGIDYLVYVYGPQPVSYLVSDLPSFPRLQNGVVDDLSPGGVSMVVLILPLSLGFNLPLGRKLGMSGGKGAF